MYHRNQFNHLPMMYINKSVMNKVCLKFCFSTNIKSTPVQFDQIKSIIADYCPRIVILKQYFHRTLSKFKSNELEFSFFRFNLAVFNFFFKYALMLPFLKVQEFEVNIQKLLNREKQPANQTQNLENFPREVKRLNLSPHPSPP